MTPESLDARWLSLGAAIVRAKDEIRADAAAGTIPATIATFADLHDHVDANEYGGLTDGSTGLHGEALIAFGNVVQDAVDSWIARGGFAEAVRADARRAAR